MLRPVVNKQTGLNKGGVMSHVSLTEVPAYHKMVLTTDGGMLPYPTLEQEKAHHRKCSVRDEPSGVRRAQGMCARSV